MKKFSQYFTKLFKNQKILGKSGISYAEIVNKIYKNFGEIQGTSPVTLGTNIRKLV